KLEEEHLEEKHLLLQLCLYSPAPFITLEIQQNTIKLNPNRTRDILSMSAEGEWDNEINVYKTYMASELFIG
ncbi:hypothetical protein L9F63_017070, partial [Diploptera punctata]